MLSNVISVKRKSHTLALTPEKYNNAEYTFNGLYRVIEFAESILFIKQINDDTERKRKTEKHGCMDSARFMWALQQPQYTAEQQQQCSVITAEIYVQ